MALTKRRFDQPDDVLRYPRATLDVVKMDSSIGWRMTLEPGWRYSESIGPVEGTESCPGEHLFMLMLAGRLAVERIDIPAAVFAGLDGDGRFRDTRRYYDVAAMMRQLGLEDGE